MAGPWERYGGESEKKPWERYGAQAQGDDTFNAFLSGAADAASFGFGDELQGVFGGDAARDAARQRQEDYRARHGGAFMAGQLGGSVGLGLATAGVGTSLMGARLAAAAAMARNAGPLTRIGIGAGAGAVGAAAYGAGDARDGNRLKSAVSAAPWGAVGGGAAHAVLGEFAPFVGGKIMAGMSPETRAAKFLSETLGRHGQDAQAVERNLMEQAPYGGTLMDAVRGGPEMVNQAAARPSASKLAARETFDARNNAAGAAAIDDAWQSLNGTSRQTADTIVTGLEDVQKKAAQPFYAAAYQIPVKPSPMMSAAQELMRRNPKIFEAAKEFAEDRALSRTGRVGDPSDAQYWHDLLEGAQTELGKRLQAGKMGNLQGFSGSQSYDYTRAVDAFNRQVRSMLGDDFRKAQDIYAGAAKSQAAIKLGRDAIGAGADDIKHGQVLRWMRRASRAEIEHMRMGALSKIANMIENADTGSGKADAIRAIMRNEGQRRILTSLFGGTGKIDDLLKRLDIRRDLFDNTVRSGIGVNSHTADRLLGAQAQAAQTRPSGAGMSDMLYRLLMRESADRFDERVSDQIIRTMMMPAPEALQALRNSSVSGVVQRRGLLSRALREAEEAKKRRPQALRNAAIGGLLYGPAGQAAGQYGTSF